MILRTWQGPLEPIIESFELAIRKVPSEPPLVSIVDINSGMIHDAIA